MDAFVSAQQLQSDDPCISKTSHIAQPNSLRTVFGIQQQQPVHRSYKDNQAAVAKQQQCGMPPDTECFFVNDLYITYVES